MISKGLKRYYTLLIILLLGSTSFGQNVPLGIFYQAVARDNNGKELVNRDIDVKFSIISGNPLGTVVYQELHSDVNTTKYGVFSLIIGHGTQTGGLYSDLSQIHWNQAFHYLKVEVKFDNDFIDMGTMQFLAVPYALYAQKSLEPGPQGPKGDPGDPASDNQTLSFNGNNLSISNGNTVNLSTLNVPHQLTLIGDTLSILGGNKVALTNQIQDLQLDVNNLLKITKNPSATVIDLSKFNQSLSFNPSDNKLTISGGTPPVDLTSLKNDADSDPTNELQTLTYNKNTGDLSISSKNTVNLLISVGFKAKKSISQTGLTQGSTYPFVNSDVEFNDGAGYDSGTGSFTAPMSGIYTFCITYKADGPGSARVLNLLKNGIVYEILDPDITSGTELTKWVTMKLDQGNVVSMTINTGTSTFSGTGTFIGYKVN
jgi:C1q domain